MKRDEAGEAMAEKSSGYSSILNAAVAMGILGIGIVALSLMIAHGRADPPVKEPEKLRDPVVETAQVVIQQERLDLDVDGVVVPRREIAVAAEVGGRVVEKADVCEAGKYVRKGQRAENSEDGQQRRQEEKGLLVRIDPSDYEFEVRRLEKELEQAKASVKELDVAEKNTQELITLAEGSLELQQKELGRLEQLAGRKEKYVSPSQVDQERRNELTARTALVTQQNQLRTIQAQRERLKAAQELVQANLEKADLNLARTAIVAPIDGIVVKDSVELDAYIAPGTVVATIEDVSQCDVRCNLRMEELYWIWNQPSAEGASASEAMGRDYLLPPTPTTVIYRMGDAQYEWDGVLTRYDGIGLDETTRTVPCIVVVKEPNKVRRKGASGIEAVRGPRALVRGMYVELKIHVKPQAALLQVPEGAIRPGNRVWRVRGGKLNIIPVHVVSVMDDRVVVAAKQQRPELGKRDETLLPGDLVVTSQLAAVQDGMSVESRAEKSP